MRHPTKRALTIYHLLLLAGMLFVLGAIWLFLAVPTFAQPPIPHTLEGRDNCLACHDSGAASIPQMPEDHAGRANETCQACHSQDTSESAVPYIPHTLEGREDCVACHAPAPADAVIADEPTATPNAIPTPIAYPEPVGDTNTCLDCHQALGGRSEEVVRDWQESIHAERGVVCADCHGGDPNAEGPTESMNPDAGYIGRPELVDIPDLCGSCHANVSLMRQYDLPTDQLAKYNESFHGQKLTEGDTKVATCTSCHNDHAIRKRIIRKRVSIIPMCPNYVLGATLTKSTWQITTFRPTSSIYESSVHGIALLDEQNSRAPSCATCHGTHGAAPPGYDEVANVCGSCHDATQNYFLDSPHNSDNPDAPLCVTCHGRYDVQKPTEMLFVGDDPRHCGSCHEPDSDVGSVVSALYQSLVDADESLTAAEEAITEAIDLGMIMSEEESLLVEARTKLITARAAQHTVNLVSVKEESLAAIEISGQAKHQAEDAIEESRFRRQAMVVALIIIGLIIGSLVIVRRQLE